ncbi:MAG: hypothetical protein AB7K24_33825 [Gemmataceae bacterium]
MTKLLADATLADKLADLLEPVEVVDVRGRILGRFLPRLDPRHFQLDPQISNWNAAGSPMSRPSRQQRYLPTWRNCRER